MKKTSILFLCTGNSARSIMAEAIANHHFGGKLAAQSAGAQPKDQPHPLTLATLSAHGISTAGLRSKDVKTLVDQPFDLVITVCDAARQACPVFPKARRTVHWNLPDPPAAANPKDMFEAVFEILEEAIGLIANGPDPDPVQSAVEAGRQISRRFSPRAV